MPIFFFPPFNPERHDFPASGKTTGRRMLGVCIMKQITKAIYILSMVFPAWLQAGQHGCKVTYNAETGRAILPCVEVIESGAWYDVNLQRRQGLDFSVAEAFRLSEISVEEVKKIPVTTQLIETESSNNQDPERWLFVRFKEVDGCAGLFDLASPSDPSSGNEHGRIDAKIFRVACPNPTLGFPSRSFADVVRVRTGPYDIYINGELIKTVEVPPPDNQSP